MYTKGNEKGIKMCHYKKKKKTKKQLSKAQNKAAGRKEQKSYIQKTMNKMAILSLFLSVITLYVIG